MGWFARAAGAAVLASLALVQPALAANPQVRLLNADATSGLVTLKVGKAATKPAVRAGGAASAFVPVKTGTGGVVTLRALQGRRLLLARKVRLAANERATVALTRVGGKRRLVLVREPVSLGPTTSSLRLVSLVPTDALTLTADGLPLVRNLAPGRASRILPYPALGRARLVLKRGSTALATADVDLPGGVLTVLAAVPKGAGASLVVLQRAANPPRATTDPSLISTRALGVVEAGDTLTCRSGIWVPATGLAFAYEWLRDGEVMAGRTTATYVLDGPDDAEHEITCRVTAGSAATGSIRRAATNSASLPAFPVSTPDSPPSVQGVPDAGITVTCDPGLWTGARSFAYAWLRNGAPIGGATSATYPVVEADDGQQLACRVVAENRSGSTTATSAAVVPGDTPGNVSAPQVMTPFKDGTAITTTDGTWSPTDGLTFAYEWLRCDSPNVNCITIVGETSASYTPGADDVGMTLVARVTATRAGFASSPAESNPTDPIAPRSTAVPTITVGGAGPADGITLTAVSPDASWNGATSLTRTYQWLRDGADISAATASTYDLVPADVGSVISVEVTASKNGSAPTTATSAATARVNPLAIDEPAITGTPRDGATLTAASPDADWNGATGLTRVYTWQRSNGAGWVAFDTSAPTTSTTDTVVLSDAEVGELIRVSVSASKNSSSGTFSGYAPETSRVAPIWTGGAPDAPLGSLIDDGVLTAPGLDEGEWSGSATTDLIYQWLQCDDAGGSCSVISGETGDQYTLRTADVGGTISVILQGAAVGGTVRSDSTQSTAAGVIAPKNTALPAVQYADAPRAGANAVAVGTTNGSWNGATGLDPFTYRWFTCTTTSFATCTVVSGETGSTYTPQVADVGRHIRSEVTASKNGGATVAISDATLDMVGQLDNTAVPTIDDTTPTVGQTLDATDGTWSDTPTATFAYLWETSTNGTDWDPATGAGATTSQYQVAVADYNHVIRVRVTASNAVAPLGEQVFSTATSAVAGIAPANTAVPTFGGTEEVGSTLTMTSAGTWTGTPTPTLSRNWQRADFGDTNWADIGGATATTYVLTPADDGKIIRLRVHATNAEGSDDAFSDPTGAIAGEAAANTAAPVLSGTELVGELLSVTDGTWTGTPTPALTYRWERSPDGTSWSPIGGETAATYTLVGADSGNQVRAVVVGTNPFGAVDGPSNATGVIP